MSISVQNQSLQKILDTLAGNDPDKKEKARLVLEQIQVIEGQITDVLGKMEKKVKQLEYLTGVFSLLNSTLDPKSVREKTLQATCQVLECETASLLLVDPEKGDLFWETALGDAGKSLQKTLRLPINNRSIAGYVAMTGESLIINDVEKNPMHLKLKVHSKNQFAPKTMLCVPLKSKDRIIGVLQALNKKKSTGLQLLKNKKYDWPCFYADDLQLLETLSYQVAIAVENSQLYAELKGSFYDTVEALAEAIEKKDRYTGGHTKRVVHFSVCIAKYLDLTEEELDRVRLGAILHDVGKIGIEDKILKKPAELDHYEWPIMKKHPDIGYEIMGRVKGLKDVTGAMRFHHERWDGKGYPLGLKGEEIPLMARIIAVADTYDAMVSTRPYRKGMETKIAFDEILKHKGTQFCPRVVDAFVLAFQNEKMGKGSGGSSVK